MRSALNWFLTALFILAVSILIITFSIGLPIYCRFFYYAHINALDIPKITGYEYGEIKQAYDQVLNYLTLPNVEFGTGVFAHSQEGASHFADCKMLFNLNIISLLCSATIVLALFFLDKKKIIKIYRIKEFSPAFYSAILIFVTVGVLGAIISVNFDSAFTVFHKLFFPGKDNWTFHPAYDEIILALPQQFFMNCAILIGSSISVICLTIIISNLIRKAKTNKKD